MVLNCEIHKKVFIHVYLQFKSELKENYLALTSLKIPLTKITHVKKYCTINPNYNKCQHLDFIDFFTNAHTKPFYDLVTFIVIINVGGTKIPTNQCQKINFIFFSAIVNRNSNGNNFATGLCPGFYR